jgi:serine/threonine-protein kinase RsbT
MARSPRIRVPLREESDVVMARRCARELAVREGLPRSAVEALAIAISEVALNVVEHARAGEIVLRVVRDRGRRGIMVVARDEGPGISDVDQAMQDGYTTANGLGLGLSSARRLVSEFAIESAVGNGTVVTMTQWSLENGDG